jgi:hypothetical protein
MFKLELIHTDLYYVCIYYTIHFNKTSVGYFLNNETNDKYVSVGIYYDHILTCFKGNVENLSNDSLLNSLYYLLR